MNKIDKIDRELEKAREKAAEWQEDRELEKQKQEEENSQIVAPCSLKLTPAELMAFLNDPANRFAASGQNGPKQEHPQRRTTPMKKTKPFRLAAMTASLFCALTLFTVPAYAQRSEPQPETTPPPEKPKPSRKPRIPLPWTAPERW